ncbi:MAG: tRNA 2-selenouridine(34) synthase MnmH [Cyanobacteriota bacterium]
MPQRLEVEAFLQGRGPVLDVRSPAEFAQGHIPGAFNLPLFSDQERAAVGTTYKQEGRQPAIDLGLRLIGPRLADLSDQLRQHQDGSGLRLHCWRGGLRSGSVAWLAELLERRVQLLEGGYKAYRQWVLARLEDPWPIQLLGGRTGCGKTDLLLALQRRGSAVIDLEGLAHHRGSSFGGLGQPPQPSNEHFENRLVDRLVALRDRGPIWVEAESAQIGRCRIPIPLWKRMQNAPVLEVTRPLSVRLQRLVALYGGLAQEELAEATERIARRLGPQRTATALAAIADRDWALAAAQMLDYYDRCYDHELSRRQLSHLGTLDLGDLEDDAAADCLLRHGAAPGAA